MVTQKKYNSINRDLELVKNTLIVALLAAALFGSCSMRKDASQIVDETLKLRYIVTQQAAQQVSDSQQQDQQEQTQP